MHHATQILDRMSESHEQIMSAFANIGARDVPASAGAEVGGRARRPAGVELHTYGGRFHMFPEGWKLPSLSLTQFINLYMCGDKEAGVPPLRLVTIDHMKDHFNRPKKTLYEMRYLMKHVERAARARNLWCLNHLDWTLEKSIKMYDGVQHLFKFPPKRNKNRRHNELSWRTVNNILQSRKGKLVGEQ